MGHIRYIRLFPTPESDSAYLSSVELDDARFDLAVTLCKFNVRHGRENTDGNIVG